jgi:histidinol phosphatase-like enzyme
VNELASAGARIDAVYYCPHPPDDRCGCRKPMPGLLQRAATDWALDLTRCVFVGDSPTDAQAADAAGCRSIVGAAAGNIPSLVAHALTEVSTSAYGGAKYRNLAEKSATKTGKQSL